MNVALITFATSLRNGKPCHKRSTIDYLCVQLSIYSFFMDSESTARPMVLSPLSTYLRANNRWRDSRREKREAPGRKHTRAINPPIYESERVSIFWKLN